MSNVSSAASGSTQPEEPLSSPMVAGLLLKLKEECEAQHARAERAEAALASQPEGWQPHPAILEATFQLRILRSLVLNGLSDTGEIAELLHVEIVKLEAALPPPPAGEPGGQT
jgi:hypothetical protein